MLCVSMAFSLSRRFPVCVIKGAPSGWEGGWGNLHLSLGNPEIGGALRTQPGSGPGSWVGSWSFTQRPPLTLARSKARLVLTGKLEAITAHFARFLWNSARKMSVSPSRHSTNIQCFSPGRIWIAFWVSRKWERVRKGSTRPQGVRQGVLEDKDPEAAIRSRPPSPSGPEAVFSLQSHR